MNSFKKSKNAGIMYLTILLLLSACGMETGNPFRLPLGASDRFNFSFSKLPELVCNRIRYCFSTDAPSCEDSFKGDNFWGHFLALENVDKNFFDYQDDITEQKFSENYENINICSVHSSSISCSDPMLLDAYDSNQPTDYSKLFLVLGGEPKCRQMIEP